MSIYEHIKALLPAGIGNLLSKGIYPTALAFVLVIACAALASAQSVLNKADPNPSAAAMSVGPTISLKAARQAQNPPIEATPAWPQAPNKPGDATTTSSNLIIPPLDPNATPVGLSLAVSTNQSDLSASQLAKGVTNPVTDLWMLQFQFNNVKLESVGASPVSGKWVNNLYFQPVLPVALTNDLNLVTRPVITMYNSLPHPTATGGSARTTTFGDMILAQVFSPAHTEPWIFGAGPTWIFPTAGSTFTGQGKWQVGPAIGGGYITDKFMIAALAQQWWDFAGDANRRHTNQANILPLIYRYFDDGWSVGYSGAILADWTARGRDVWTVPLGLSVGKVVMFGKLPVQIQLAGQYFVDSPVGGPKWNVQLQITPVIPRLIQEVLFQ